MMQKIFKREPPKMPAFMDVVLFILFAFGFQDPDFTFFKKEPGEKTNGGTGLTPFALLPRASGEKAVVVVTAWLKTADRSGKEQGLFSGKALPGSDG